MAKTTRSTTTPICPADPYPTGDPYFPPEQGVPQNEMPPEEPPAPPPPEAPARSRKG